MLSCFLSMLIVLNLEYILFCRWDVFALKKILSSFKPIKLQHVHICPIINITELFYALFLPDYYTYEVKSAFSYVSITSEVKPLSLKRALFY